MSLNWKSDKNNPKPAIKIMFETLQSRFVHTLIHTRVDAGDVGKEIQQPSAVNFGTAGLHLYRI